MGLFMNKGEHPDVFMNQSSIEEPNQSFFKIDYFKELVKSQKKMNDSLFRSFHELEFLYQQQQHTQAREWKEIGDQLHALKECNLQHEKFKRDAMEWLTMLDENNKDMHRLLEEEGLLKQGVLEEINSVNQSNQEIVNQLGKYEFFHEQLTNQMNELFDLHKEMSSKIANQDENQNKTLNHLEKQEALMEKAVRQITHLRSILFERTNFLAEKIENSYKLTSSFVYNLVTGSDQPLTFRMSQKKEEAKKSD
ncbi:hypothetical protein ACW2QC_19520 [Virgibacillus sp. FSP13]